MSTNNWERYLDELAAQGILLWPDGDDLLFEGSAAVLTDDTFAYLRQYKAELLDCLRHANAQQPLSLGQQGIWLDQQLAPDGFAYHVSLALRILSPVQPEVLQAAFQHLVNRHAALRTTFPLVEGEQIRRIYRYREVILQSIDAQGWPEEQLEQAVKSSHEQPFALEQGPLFRLHLYAGQRGEHLLLFTLHHLLCDGWSLWMLLDELRSLYPALVADMPGDLPPLQTTYNDYVDWQTRTLQEQEPQLWAYWQQKLAGELPILNLRSAHARPTKLSRRGASQVIELAGELMQQLTTIAQREGVTLYMLLLAAYQVLLYRYSGQEDILVGSPFAGRSRPEFAAVFGYFTSPLVLRADLAGNPPFCEFLQQVRQSVLEALDHQDYPFSRLVERLQPPRHAGISPIYQAMFALQRAQTDAQVVALVAGSATEPIDFGGLRLLSFPLPQYEEQADLFLNLFYQPAALAGSLKYNPDLFDRATIARMIGHYQELLKGIVAEPTQLISNLPLLTPQERQQLLVEWNDTATNDPDDKTIHQLFEEQVERTPGAVAVVMAEDKETSACPALGAGRQGAPARTGEASQKQLTYAELNTRANQLAHYLQTLGVGPETLVGICMERSLEMVVGLLGILKAGGAYVPLDPNYPVERLAFILQDAAPSVIVTQRCYQQQLSASAPLIFLDADNPSVARQPSHNPSLQPTGLITTHRGDEHRSTNLAYVIYTSGSTGQPKGVLLEHRGLVNLAQAQIQAFAVQPGNRVLQLASLNFDASISEIVMALCAGATLVLASPDQLLPAEPLTHTLQTQAISHVTLVPSVLAFLNPITLPNLQTVIVAGEACPPSLAQRWSVGRHFYNAYGPTETTVCATIMACHDRWLSPNTLPIGRPIANLQLYILDPYLQPVPLGMPGELCISGVGVARGYLKRPALTTERFITNPFGTGRLYKTGDLVRYLPDGNLEYLGRIDQQVKLRGFRIELGEIEAVLRQHSAVQEALVIAREEQDGNKQLVAYVTAAGADEETQHEHVSTWQSLYEESYSQPAVHHELSLNLTGWNSSYTGKPIAEEEMIEWVENTVAEIRSLQPKRILEIGCGAGLLLARLAPDCEEYWGMDYSQQALAHVARLRDATPGLAHVQLAQRMADDFTGMSEASFDCVILNSVVQYFPSIDYLLCVLTGAVKLVKPGGVVYVGDVRNYRLLAAYHASVQRYQANDEEALSALQTRIQQRLQDEEELLIDPAFFHALPQALPAIGAVQVRLKSGRAHNELTCFRYQVFLHIGNRGEERQVVSNLQLPCGSHSEFSMEERAWSQIGSLPALQICLQTASSPGLWVRNLPNARVQADLETLEELTKQRLTTVGQLRSYLAKQPSAVEPADLADLAAALSYQVHLLYAAEAGKMDACFMRWSAAPSPILHQGLLPVSNKVHPPKNWPSYSNNPLLGKLSRTLVPQLRRYLQSKLPEYMVPTAFVLLDAFPLTPNSKIDRKTLPSPTLLRRRDEASLVPPRTANEHLIADIWSAVLGIEQVGIYDNFFELGGHSLLATQVISRIRERLHIEIPLRALFENPTIEGLAQRVRIVDTLQRMAPLHSTPTMINTNKVEEEW